MHLLTDTLSLSLYLSLTHTHIHTHTRTPTNNNNKTHTLCITFFVRVQTRFKIWWNSVIKISCCHENGHLSSYAMPRSLFASSSCINKCGYCYFTPWELVAFCIINENRTIRRRRCILISKLAWSSEQVTIMSGLKDLEILVYQTMTP